MADEEKKADKAAKQPKGGKGEKPAGGSPKGKGEAAARGKGDGKAAAKAAPAAPKTPRPKDYKPRMKLQYEKVVRDELTKRFGYKNHMQVPRLDKIVLNMGVGEGVADRKKVEQAAEALTAIVGQKAVITRSRKSIATYKLRENMPIGAKVTLRGDRMYEFLDRLVTIALPRVKDFRGLNPKSFDGRGNYALGLREHIVFPEIDYDKVDEVRGMDVIVCTTAGNDDEARELLRGFNFPFRS